MYSYRKKANKYYQHFGTHFLQELSMLVVVTNNTYNIRIITTVMMNTPRCFERSWPQIKISSSFV